MFEEYEKRIAELEERLKEKEFTYMELGRIISYIIEVAESKRDFETKAEIIAEELANNFDFTIKED